MELLLAIVYIAIGAALLGTMADILVKGASALAIRLGLSNLVIGLTVVALGTSLPEFVTSIQGGATIALGNVAGSNIVNLGLILGLTALLCPLACESKFLRFEMPLMVLTGPLFLLACWGGVVTRLEGVLLLAGLVAYLWISVKRGSLDEADALISEAKEALESGALSTTRIILYIVGGLVGLVAGGRLLVDGAIELAEFAGISERVIALTIVAGGTSLPELATCVAAARRGYADMALGNLVGSNIFNILGIIGAAAIIIGPMAVPDGFKNFDVPAVILIQALCIPIMITRMKVSRIEGGVLLAFYVVYTVLLFTWQRD